MKKLFYLLLIVPMVLMGCKKGAKDAEPETVKLSVTPNSIISPSIGADYSLTLTAPESWTASCADSWVKINPVSGNAGTVEISVKIAADKTSTEASSKIVFKSGDQTVEVPVKRLAKDPALKIVSETEIKTPKEGGAYSIQVESNIKWQISSNVSWAKVQGEAVKRNNAIITVNVDPATKPEETVGTLTVSPMEGTGIEKQTVTITRSASDATSMTIDKSRIDAPSEGGLYSVTVNTTVKWRATKSLEADWLTLGSAEGNGNGSFTIKVEPATSSEELSTVVTISEVRSDDYQPVQLDVVVTRGSSVTLKGAFFSVSATNKVYFSQGNLQYLILRGSGKDIFRFAEHQWDFVGDAEKGNVYYNGQKCDNNKYFGMQYEGWIDMFAWGTGDKPWSGSTDNAVFAEFHEWGANQISNGGNQANLWRTLTKDEWVYLFFKRDNASTLRGYGTVNGVAGLILLPDNWEMPTGVAAFQPTFSYTANDWTKMENNGAVFLPAAGVMSLNDFQILIVRGLGEVGAYWSCTPSSSALLAHVFNFDSTSKGTGAMIRYLHLSVRLVRDAN
ncbi:MAG: BACON domain-containing protein [Paludibacteraceae bacterium]|nr:BACON domain-containing protein [Paludibacteraceae bacterium]